MSKLFSPNISSYEKLVPFFEDFYALNKEKNKKFSYQYLANKLGWSAPYLNDIFKGRKRLSLNRALEFMDLLELKGLAAERFLILFLADSDSAFAKSTLKQEALAGHNSLLKPSTQDLQDFAFQYETVFEYYLLFYIHFNKGVWNVQQFLDQLTLTTKPSPENLEKLIQKLLRKRRLEFNPKTQTYRVLADQHQILHHEPSKPDREAIRKQITQYAQEYGQSYLDYLQNPVLGKATYFFGMINLNEEMYQDVKTRVLALHNYLIELSEKSKLQDHADPNFQPGAESRIWQYQLNLFSVFEGDERKAIVSSGDQRG